MSGKTELKFKTATTTTEEQPGKSSTGGSKAKETKTSGGKSKGNTAEKTDKKGKKATAGKVLGTGLSVGLGMAGALQHKHHHKMMDDR